MEFIPNNPILEFNPDTLQYLRALYDLEKPGRMEEAINILIEWMKKQDHLIKKDFTREYLERMIIFSKGSVERAKLKLDKACTFKTLLPDYFEPFDMKNSKILKDYVFSFLPKMTKDHYRILAIQNKGQRFENGLFDTLKYLIVLWEYLQRHDYCNGVFVIVDYSECNLFEFMKSINLVEMRQAMSILMEGYGMRIKGIHILTSSKAIDTIISLFKQVLNAKVAQRINVHMNAETLFEHIERDILPIDYGGKEKYIKTLSDNLMDILSSEEFKEYFNMMKQARTNEALRIQGTFNDQYMGVAGSFRKLSVD